MLNKSDEERIPEHLDLAYSAGKKAYFKSKTYRDNPYEKDTSEYDSWFMGFVDASHSRTIYDELLGVHEN